MAGQGDGMPVRDRRVLLRRSPGPLPGGLPDPHPRSDPRRIDPRTDGVDHPGAVLVGHLLTHAGGDARLRLRQSVGLMPEHGQSGGAGQS